MSVVMKIVFSLSLSGALLILVLLLCKPFIKNRFSRQWQYYIWLIVIARLILPVAPEVSAVGILFSHNTDNTQKSAAPVSEGAMSQNFPTAADTMIQYRDSGQRDGASAVSEISIHNVRKSLLQNLWIPWLVVALLLLLRKITIYQSFVKYIKAGRKEISDTALLDRLAQIGEQAGVKHPVELYGNSLVSSPLLIGFFRPCIILPTAELTEEDFTFTVWHEIIHFKRKDMFYKWLVQITACLHWFNPLVWLMGREINDACEFSCDEAVLGTLGGQQRRAYGDTLFRALGAGGRYKDFPVSVTLNEGTKLLKERLGAIMDFKKSSKLVTTLSIILTAAMMMGATVMGAYVEPVRTVKIMEVVSANTSSEQTQPEKNNIGSANIGNSDVEDKNSSKSEESMERLAEQYYEKDMLIQFGAIFSSFDESMQRKWLDRIYADDEISYFSIALNHLHNASPVIEDFAQRAYADDKVNFFSVLIWYMSEDLLNSWQDRVMEEDMGISFQSVLLGADDIEASIENARKEDEEQYIKWGIIREGDNYYYQGQLVHLFYDKYDAQTAIRTISINPLGTVDVKVTRSVRNKIMSVDYMTQEEVEELFGMDDFSGLDCDIEEEEFEVGEKEFDMESDVYRLAVEELPEEVVNRMRNCKIRTWYVIHCGGRQYIRYQGFAWNYAYQPIYGEDGWRIDVKRLEKKDYGNVLLSLPDNGPVKVYCDGQEVELVEIGK